MSRVTFYDPYLEILGGGEKVLLTILEDVAASGAHEVLIMSPSKPDLASWQRLGISVNPRRVRWRSAGQLTATPLSASADLFVTLTNHFPPLSLARRSTAIIQFPFAHLGGGGPLERMRAIDRRRRLASYDTVLCYSEFVADEIRRRLGVSDPQVIAPPVDLPGSEPPLERDRIVIAVGRFFPAADANNKKHEILIDAWRRLSTSPEVGGWELHLVGGLHGDRESLAHLEHLRSRALGLPVHFHPNATTEELESLYARSALFWHAAGFGEVQAERHEHFGITTVEAMAHGCVPVVIALGGQLEIVRDGVNGRLWRTVAELVSVTEQLIADPERRQRLAAVARADAARYGKPMFVSAVRERVLDPAGVHVG